MVDNLYERSLVDRVFVSPCSKVSSPLSARDLTEQDEILGQLKNIHGNTKGKSVRITVYYHIASTCIYINRNA